MTILVHFTLLENYFDLITANFKVLLRAGFVLVLLILQGLNFILIMFKKVNKSLTTEIVVVKFSFLRFKKKILVSQFSILSRFTLYVLNNFFLLQIMICHQTLGNAIIKWLNIGLNSFRQNYMWNFQVYPFPSLMKNTTKPKIMVLYCNNLPYFFFLEPSQNL